MTQPLARRIVLVDEEEEDQFFYVIQWIIQHHIGIDGDGYLGSIESRSKVTDEVQRHSTQHGNVVIEGIRLHPTAEEARQEIDDMLKPFRMGPSKDYVEIRLPQYRVGSSPSREASMRPGLIPESTDEFFSEDPEAEMVVGAIQTILQLTIRDFQGKECRVYQRKESLAVIPPVGSVVLVESSEFEVKQCRLVYRSGESPKYIVDAFLETGDQTERKLAFQDIEESGWSEAEEPSLRNTATKSSSRKPAVQHAPSQAPRRTPGPDLTDLIDQFWDSQDETKGVPDYRTAVLLGNRLVDAGFEHAHVWLGNLHGMEKIKGVSSAQKAEFHYHRAAEAGIADGFAGLARLYEGEDRPSDAQIAWRHFFNRANFETTNQNERRNLAIICSRYLLWKKLRRENIEFGDRIRLLREETIEVCETSLRMSPDLGMHYRECVAWLRAL